MIYKERKAKRNYTIVDQREKKIAWVIGEFRLVFNPYRPEWESSVLRFARGVQWRFHVGALKVYMRFPSVDVMAGVSSFG